jgi:hypothetical protein
MEENTLTVEKIANLAGKKGSKAQKSSQEFARRYLVLKLVCNYVHTEFKNKNDR